MGLEQLHEGPGVAVGVEFPVLAKPLAGEHCGFEAEALRPLDAGHVLAAGDHQGDLGQSLPVDLQGLMATFGLDHPIADPLQELR